MAKYIMSLDAGTTSNRCILFDREGRMVSVSQKEFTMMQLMSLTQLNQIMLLLDLEQVLQEQ